MSYRTLCTICCNASTHYHMKLLEEAEPVRFVGTRPGPNSIMEKLYSATPVQDSRDETMTSEEKSAFYLNYTLDSIGEMHREAEELIKSEWAGNPFIAGCYAVYAPETEARKLKRRLAKMLDDFHQKFGKPAENARATAITFGILPTNAAGWQDTRRVFDMMQV